VHPGRCARGGSSGKIVTLRARARDDLGLAATCLLSALGREFDDFDDEYARAFVGATIIVEELRAIRALLTAPG
jgi:hypothetical protein